MKNIKFLELYKVNKIIEQELKDAVNKVIESGWYIMGEQCSNFEKKLADNLGGNGFGIGCNSGTDAIILALKAVGVQAGDEVITVSHTAIPTVAAITSVGAVPVFVDIDDKTWVMDVSKVKEKISNKTKAVIGVHLYGNMFDVFELKKLLTDINRTDISVIEDVAQAHGSMLNNQYAGSIGDIGSFSFYPSKNIGALGDAGALFTKNPKYHEAILMYRNYGQKDRYHALINGGINSRLDEIQAAILSVKLKYIKEWNKTKLSLMELYCDELKNLPITFQKVTNGCVPAWHLCVIRLNDDINREKFMDNMNNEGVQTLIHYPYPVHTQEGFSEYKREILTNTESIAKQIVSLPFSYISTREDIEYICNAVRKSLVNR